MRHLPIILALLATPFAASAIVAPTITIKPGPLDRVAVRIADTTGTSYTLEAARNTTGPWMVVLSGTFTGGPVTLLDTKQAQRFYRVRAM